jgi:hypothetical protein
MNIKILNSFYDEIMKIAAPSIITANEVVQRFASHSKPMARFGQRVKQTFQNFGKPNTSPGAPWGVMSQQEVQHNLNAAGQAPRFATARNKIVNRPTKIISLSEIQSNLAQRQRFN